MKLKLTLVAATQYKSYSNFKESWNETENNIHFGTSGKASYMTSPDNNKIINH